MSFLSKKAENILHKTTTIGPTLGRSGSLEIGRSGSGLILARSSLDKPRVRLRRLSFRSSTPVQNEVTSAPDTTFTAIVKRLEQSRDILSSSPGISLSPPALFVSFAAIEKRDPSHVLRADERAGLKSIRGWAENDLQGNGIVGTLGFVRQQEFSVLHSRHVPSVLPHPPATNGSLSTQNPPTPIYTPCDKPRWITYHFYSRNKGSDKILGDAVTDLCSAADQPCDTNGCQFKRGEHELRMIHAGLRIVLRVEPRQITEESSQKDIIEMWESCKTCGAISRRNLMSDGTYLISFAKFLELLCYSPAMCTLTPTLCEHTTPSPSSPDDLQLPKSRLEIIRHFSFRSYTTTVQLSSVDDIFDLRVPKLHILRNTGQRSIPNVPSESSVVSEGTKDTSAEEEKQVLKREIKSWWQGVSEHMDKLEVNLTRGRSGSFSKSLPRLPSVEDDFDASTTVTPKAHTSELPLQNPELELTNDSESSTPKAKARTLPPLPSETLDSALNINQPSHKSRDNRNALPPLPEKDHAGPDGKSIDSLHRLQSLRHSFQRTEQSLYSLLARTPISSLNDVRTSFLSAAKGATRRLSAWQKKHLRQTIKGQMTIGDLSVPEPEWWNKSWHAVPGGNIIVRETDWGSIIAFTLASTDYQRELADMSSVKTVSSIPSVPSPSLPTPTNQSSFFKSNPTHKLFSSSSAKPDPDQEGIIWHEPESYSAVISRKEHPRDHTSLLSIREVLRSRPPTEGSGDSQSRNIGGGLPPSALVKPSVEINKHAAGGVVSGLPEVDTAGKLLQEIEVASTDSSHTGSISGGDTSQSQFGDPHIHRAKASSLLSGESDSTVGPGDREDGIAEPPALPPKDSEPPSLPAQTNSSFASSVTNSLTNAMRFMLNTGESLRSGSPSFMNKHGLLNADSSNIDERPHIKYDWMIGKRLKFSCTVYYAKQFDALRHRCGIEDVFLKSIKTSSNWAAEGGKSKSNFWKTSDDRFIIKTLVNAWNVADLSVLIELAPSYFRYMESTWKDPSALAKVLGFYTVEIKNLESGNTQAKVDLLLMENLFYDQKISKTFDLKGIQGRKVKAASSGSSLEPQNTTLFDGEWIEGQQRTLTLVPPHSKVVLNEAVKNDCNFLSKNNIMDYSLLLGVDEERKQIVCGLVDTIGSYTFAKTLEYKAKQGLSTGKDVTVIPPAEYQRRFLNALDGYFLACPDKWSQPLDGSKVINDVSLLPCIL